MSERPSKEYVEHWRVYVVNYCELNEILMEDEHLHFVSGYLWAIICGTQRSLLFNFARKSPFINSSSKVDANAAPLDTITTREDEPCREAAFDKFGTSKKVRSDVDRWLTCRLRPEPTTVSES